MSIIQNRINAEFAKRALELAVNKLGALEQETAKNFLDMYNNKNNTIQTGKDDIFISNGKNYIGSLELHILLNEDGTEEALGFTCEVYDEENASSLRVFYGENGDAVIEKTETPFKE